jgi:CheY-like chemotaxis protein
MQAAATPRPAPPAEAPPLPDAPAPLGPVLLADDSAVVRAKLLRLFQGAGFDAVAVRDGVEALEALARMPFAVLVTDLEMPNMDGFELIAAVQGSLETEDLPIVAITGHEALQARVHEFGGLYGIFRKPWNDRELLRRVQSLAGLRRRPRAAA